MSKLSLFPLILLYLYPPVCISILISHDLNPFYGFNLTTDKWDEDHGYNKGEFRGASGYKPQDPRVLKLEPEDLNKACLDEIEDVNTMEGAIEQMQSNARKDMSNNAFRSNTGTTDMDIEM